MGVGAPEPDGGLRQVPLFRVARGLTGSVSLSGPSHQSRVLWKSDGPRNEIFLQLEVA